MISEGFALLFCPHPQEIAIQEKNNMPMSVACSQALYFLFKVRRAWVIKYKPQGIYWLPVQGGLKMFFIFVSCALCSFLRTCFTDKVANVFRKERKEK